MDVLIWILWKLAWAVAAIAALFCIYVGGERDAAGHRKIGNLMLFALVMALVIWALVYPSWGSLAALYVFPLGLLWWGWNDPWSVFKAASLLIVLWALFKVRPALRRYSIAALGGGGLAFLVWL